MIFSIIRAEKDGLSSKNYRKMTMFVKIIRKKEIGKIYRSALHIRRSGN